MTDRSRGPGPGSYGPSDYDGKNKRSAKPSGPSFSFGSADRFGDTAKGRVLSKAHLREKIGWNGARPLEAQSRGMEML